MKPFLKKLFSAILSILYFKNSFIMSTDAISVSFRLYILHSFLIISKKNFLLYVIIAIVFIIMILIIIVIKKNKYSNYHHHHYSYQYHEYYHYFFVSKTINKYKENKIEKNVLIIIINLIKFSEILLKNFFFSITQLKSLIFIILTNL